MNILKRIKNFFSPEIQVRYIVIKSPALTGKIPFYQELNLKDHLPRLRNASRVLTVNNPIARKYLHMSITNILGPQGIILMNKARREDGEIDIELNKRIETEFTKWGEEASVDKLTWYEVQSSVLIHLIRDGEAFVRVVKNFDNKYKFALQIIPPDAVDVKYCKNKIDMGIEYNEWGAPVKYWVIDKHKRYIDIPAEEVIHIFFKMFANQRRGIPWLTPVLDYLTMLDDYEFAELVAARIGAAKMGFYKLEEGARYIPEGKTQEELTKEVEPGSFELLPPGVDIKTFDPQHPPGNYLNYVKMMLKKIASGLNVNYNSLANDLEGVSYSSIRAGTLEERDNWRILQKWFSSKFHNKVFYEWLKMFILIDKRNNLNIERLFAPIWQARGWAWVDPLKDIKAHILAIQHALKSREDIANELGVTFEKVCEELYIENKILEKFGIKVPKGEEDAIPK